MASALAKQLRAPLNTSFFATNGLRIPTLRPPAKAWVRFRLIHAGTNDVLALHLQDEQACETFVVARDGYTLQDPRGDQLTRESPLVLAPGSRADVYVRCSRKTSLKSAFSEDLKTYLGAGSDVYSGSIIKIRPTASQVVTKDTDDVTGDEPRFPSTPDIPSLLAATPDRRATLEMVQRGAIVKDGNGYTDYALDVVQGDGSVTVGDVVEWTIVNMHKGAPGQVIPQDTTHPFHLHTNHFQVRACVEINQCVGCDDVAALVPSSGEEPTPPRHRADIMKIAWRSTRRGRTRRKFDFRTGRRDVKRRRR